MPRRPERWAVSGRIVAWVACKACLPPKLLKVRRGTKKFRLAARRRRRNCGSVLVFRAGAQVAEPPVFREEIMNSVQVLRTLGIAGALMASFAAQAQNRPPWPPGDEIGMANTLGTATWQRCATALANPKAKSYELSFVRSNTMPQSPFAVPLRENAKPTVGIQG